MEEIKQPRMRIIETGEESPVINLNWLDGGTTLRAFPVTTMGEVKSYIIKQGNGEDTQVNAELFYK